ncbi:hypothetical protein OG613_44745 (plasmid) [Streptomyces sp. NBC_00015]|uniref:hypothetical protein n=1 Tax=Streptomyces sp. NBC_00015 TaxID=2903611 RepID=UPI002F915EB9
MDQVRQRVAVEAELQQPLRLGRPGRGAALSLLIAPLLGCDSPPGALEIRLLHPLKEAQKGEVGRRKVVHVRF